ncbi:hypothetical protein CPC08DRAFT_769613 [Agrocybe pediades]|nr:hypothetical protein CPC08DRAFT_769613 [Agrocybe pediades]
MKRGSPKGSKAQKKAGRSSQAAFYPFGRSGGARGEESSNSNKIDVAVQELTFTTVPPERDPDGNSEWVLGEPETKQKVFSLPGFPQPMPKPLGPPSFAVRSTPDMGLGFFATRDIKVGELIFAERPLLMVPRGLRVKDLEDSMIMTRYGGEQITEKWDKTLDVAVRRMSLDDREAFLSLTNVYEGIGAGRLLGIIRTNGYPIRNLIDGPEDREPRDSYVYFSVTKTGSRINHRPNVDFDFDLASFSSSAIATKDIKAGEQLFHSYCSVENSAATRRSQLARYEFVCKCLSCVNATPASDKFRSEYGDLALASGQWVVDPRTYIQQALKLREDMLDEGLEGTFLYVYLLRSIYVMFRNLGMADFEKEIMEEFLAHNRVEKLELV